VSEVVWHDVECGSYTADLPLWRELAVSPVLDVGAGTGRVALDLARHGHDVTALDIDADLLAELDRRARGTVATVVADAGAFELDRRFASILVPMQTIQLLDDRAGFLRAAHAHLAAGGLLAVAVADELVPFEGPLVAPDTVGRFVSQPVAVRLLDDVVQLERERDDGETKTLDVVELKRLSARELEAEGRAAGLTPERSIPIAPTSDHVGAEVVRLRA
jgi:SAM-dependent methyltransferase